MKIYENDCHLFSIFPPYIQVCHTQQYYLCSSILSFHFNLFFLYSSHSTSDSTNVLVCIPNNLTWGVFMDYIFSTLIQTEDAVLDMAALQEKPSSQAASQVLLVNIVMLVWAVQSQAVAAHLPRKEFNQLILALQLEAPVTILFAALSSSQSGNN